TKTLFRNIVFVSPSANVSSSVSGSVRRTRDTGRSSRATASISAAKASSGLRWPSSRSRRPIAREPNRADGSLRRALGGGRRRAEHDEDAARDPAANAAGALARAQLSGERG